MERVPGDVSLPGVVGGGGGCLRGQGGGDDDGKGGGKDRCGTAGDALCRDNDAETMSLPLNEATGKVRNERYLSAPSLYVPTRSSVAVEYVAVGNALET